MERENTQAYNLIHGSCLVFYVFYPMNMSLLLVCAKENITFKYVQVKSENLI